jgi:hypothetical protein
VNAIHADADLAAAIGRIARFEHPCVLSIEGYRWHPEHARVTVMTELVENGALSENIRPTEGWAPAQSGQTQEKCGRRRPRDAVPAPTAI